MSLFVDTSIWFAAVDCSDSRNSRATVYLPSTGKDNFMIAESGKPLWPAKPGTSIPGVVSVQDSDGFVACEVGAGDYRFSEAATKRQRE